MRGLPINYEVVVEVEGRQQGHHIMFHFPAKSQGKAAEKGSRYGRVMSVRKVDASEFISDIENMKLKQSKPEPRGLYIGGGLYDNTLNLDEILGLRRAKRLDDNKKKDKELDK